jgi:thymidylate kinase
MEELMMGQMTEPVGKNLLVAAAIRAAIDHAQLYGDQETAADLIVILDGCVKSSASRQGGRIDFSWSSLFRV